MKNLIIMIVASILFLQTNAQNKINNVEHIVEKGQTLYFLSKKYDVSIQDLMRFNQQIGKDMIIKEGMILKIFSKPTPKLNVKNHKYHTVEKGQTLYSLSKMYNISVDDLIYLNQLGNPSIGIGDKLIIQKLDKSSLFVENKTPAKDGIPTDTKKEESKENLYNKVETVKQEGTVLKINNKDVELYKMLYESYKDSGAELNKTKGIGDFLEQSTSKDVYLALIDDIESGQVVRLRNLMNNKVIYLKVIGSIPSKDRENNISIKISQAAARDLKIVEDRFLAEWTWYKKSNSTKKEIDKSIRVTDF